MLMPRADPRRPAASRWSCVGCFSRHRSRGVAHLRALRARCLGCACAGWKHRGAERPPETRSTAERCYEKGGSKGEFRLRPARAPTSVGRPQQLAKQRPPGRGRQPRVNAEARDALIDPGGVAGLREQRAGLPDPLRRQVEAGPAAAHLDDGLRALSHAVNVARAQSNSP